MKEVVFHDKKTFKIFNAFYFYANHGLDFFRLAADLEFTAGYSGSESQSGHTGKNRADFGRTVCRRWFGRAELQHQSVVCRSKFQAPGIKRYCEKCLCR